MDTISYLPSGVERPKAKLIAQTGKVTITLDHEGYHVWNLYRYNPECRSEYVIESNLTTKWSVICKAIINNKWEGPGWKVIGT